MKKRLFWLSLSGTALLTGALLYGLCRQDTYIGAFLGELLPIRISPQNPLYGAFSWYIPDFLWMFSLTCTLFAVLLPKGKKQILWCVISCLWGILWELAQGTDLTAGTADLWDVFMYIMAVFSAAMINNLKRGN